MDGKNKGFTFLEVLAALAIVAIALVALLRLHLISIRTTERNATTTRAGLLAQEKMAELLCQGYPPIGSQTGSSTQGGSSLHWQTDVREFALPKYNRNETFALRKVSVDVHWHHGGQEKHFRLASVAAQRDYP